jgi:ABC-2 type transport system ATP-binding protein
VNDTAVRLDGVTKSFGAVRAVAGIDLNINRGETVALLGPNGAGKSTTIAMLLGLVVPDAGRVAVYGQDPAVAGASGQVGAMLQSVGFPANATVRELVDLARGIYPHPLGTDEILATAELTKIAGRRLEKLSGGEAQRARFAFALAGNPDLLILDEPTAAMDVAARQAFWAAMRRYSQAGHTVLFATHYLEEADDYADRVVVISAGRLVADGTGAEIKKIAGGRTVSFDLAGRPTAELRDLPGVTAVEIHRDRAKLSTTDSDATVLALARTGGFRDLEVSSAGLEAAFLALTGGDPARPDSDVPRPDEAGHGRTLTRSEA